MTRVETKASAQKRRIAISAVPLLLLLTVTAALVVTRVRATEEPTTDPHGIPVRSFTVEGTESVTARNLSASGTLSPIRESTLAFAVGGVVQAVATDEGDHVFPESILASLDPTPLRAALDQSEAQLLFLESRSARSEQLAESGAIAKEEFDADVSERQSAAARLTLSRWNLARSVVRAPFAGSIKERFVEVGEVVTAGTPAFHLIATDSLKLEVSVPARDLPRIGRSALVSSPDFPGL
jgi:RND family efflux transporter MFP subunit